MSNDLSEEDRFRRAAGLPTESVGAQTQPVLSRKVSEFRREDASAAFRGANPSLSHALTVSDVSWRKSV